MLIGRFFPVQAGAELQCFRLSKELIKNGFQVSVLTPVLSDLSRFEIIEGVPVYRLGIPVKGFIGSLAFVLHGLLWLTINRSKYEILHAHQASSPAVLAGFVSIITGKDSVLKFAGSRKTGDIFTSNKTLIGKIKLRFLRTSIQRYISPSEEIKTEAVESGFDPQKIQVIPNGVDTAAFRPPADIEKNELRRSFGIAQTARVSVYTGRITNGKGLEVLFDAWQHIENKIPEIEKLLLVCGSGPLENEFKEKYKNIASIRFLGWQNDTAAVLKASDIFVLPSLGEGLPNSLLEAMSCGLLCISTDIGGVRELLRNNENGILVDPDNVISLQTAIESAMIDLTRYVGFGENARREAENNFSFQNVTKTYTNYYKR
jgi:glycosyltransferase involved in cell wall biosynthesis